MRQLEDGATVWFTGLPSAGKTTLAQNLAVLLTGKGFPVELLDGDELRTNLTRGLGFSRADRAENVARVGYVASLLSRHGVVAICALISPYREDRQRVREMHEGRFFEIHVATPLSVCASRDVKGLYARQRDGELRGLTGVDDPYEPPDDPDLKVLTHHQTVEQSVEMIWQALRHTF